MSASPKSLLFQSALALHCFTNEYIYNLTGQEAEELEVLRKADSERKIKEHEENIKREAAAKAEAEKNAAVEREKEAKALAEVYNCDGFMRAMDEHSDGL